MPMLVITHAQLVRIKDVVFALEKVLANVLLAQLVTNPQEVAHAMLALTEKLQLLVAPALLVTISTVKLVKI